MTKTENIKKLLLSGACAAVLLAGATAPSFAANPANTAAHLTVPATPIDVMVTEKVSLTGSANSNELAGTSIFVKNNSAMGVIKIDSMKATAETGWSIVSDATDFTKMAKDAKDFSLVADDSFDMSTGNYTGAGSVNPGETDETKLSGQIGMYTTAVNDEKGANIVTTVSYI